MHKFIISVPILILPAFRQLLLKSGRLNFCFETSKHSVQTADDNNKVTSQALQLTLVLYIFKLVLSYYPITISNQIKYYLSTNRGNFLQIQYGFYSRTLQIHYQPPWSVIERTSTKNSRKLIPGT